MALDIHLPTIFETGSLAHCCIHQANWLVNFMESPVCYSVYHRSTGMHTILPDFIWILGIGPRVLMLVSQANYPEPSLEHSKFQTPV